MIWVDIASNTKAYTKCRFIITLWPVVVLYDTINRSTYEMTTIMAEWLKVNKSSFNIKNAHFMCFSAKNTSSPCISLKLVGKPLLKLINQNFWVWLLTVSWKDHISFVCRKVARGIGVIIKARKVLRSESLKSVYYSIIYPYMIYCNQVWGSACKQM